MTHDALMTHSLIQVIRARVLKGYMENCVMSASCVMLLDRDAAELFEGGWNHER
jgi:hypothetical protein